MKSAFFPSPTDFRAWLHKHHAKETELWVGFYKKHTGIKSITWPESVDQALCYGWIDGKRMSIDDQSYKIRFTPRKSSSHWSDVNIKRMVALSSQKLVNPSGLAAFDQRTEGNSRRAAYEQKSVVLDVAFENKIKASNTAWRYFENLSPSIKKQYIHWVMSAKQEATKLRRLEVIIESSSAGELIPLLQWAIRKK